MLENALWWGFRPLMDSIFFLLGPRRSGVLVLSSFTRKADENNSVATLFEVQNWEIEIRFYIMLGAQWTLFNLKVCWEVVRDEKSVWVMVRPESSTIIMYMELGRRSLKTEDLGKNNEHWGGGGKKMNSFIYNFLFILL